MKTLLDIVNWWDFDKVSIDLGKLPCKSISWKITNILTENASYSTVPTS